MARKKRNTFVSYLCDIIGKPNFIVLALGLIFLLPTAVLPSSADFDLRPGKKLVVKGKMFEAGSSVLAEAETPWLAQLAEYLVKRPNLFLEITGFTDNQGDSLQNKRLSEARANSVKAYLVKHGVSPTRVKSFGKGSELPIAPNDTDEGRAKNRRVEIVATSPLTERPLTNRYSTPLPPEGRITAMLPPVRTQAPWEVEWQFPKLGDAIYEYHRLETGAKARAEITFSNKHRIQIAERSQVLIYGNSASPIEGKPKEQLKLVSGGLWVNIKSVEQNQNLRVSTKNGDFSLSGSSAKIEIDSAAQSLVSVHSGKVQLQNSSIGKDSLAEENSTKEMTIGENFGTRIAPNSTPEAPRPLPPVPQLLEPLGLDSLYAGDIPFLWRKLSPRVRFEISPSIIFNKPLYAAVLDKDSAIVRLEKGDWYVKLSAIDSIGLESKSAIYLFHVVPQPEPYRFRILTLIFFIGCVLTFWWGELTKQPKQLWLSLLLLVCGALVFYVLRW